LLIEFWLADLFGRAWLRLNRSLKPMLGEMPGECALLARRKQLPAGRLWRVQDFAARVWWRFGMTAALLGCAIAAATLAVSRGRVGTDIAVASIFAGAGVAGVAMAEMGMIRYRSNQNRLSWARAGASAGQERLPEGSAGLPEKSDFWLMFLIAGVVSSIIIYAATRSAHH
jgi:hypothetical protein